MDEKLKYYLNDSSDVDDSEYDSDDENETDPDDAINNIVQKVAGPNAIITKGSGSTVILNTGQQVDDAPVVKQRTKAEEDLRIAYAKVLEFVTNTFYTTPENGEIRVQLVDGGARDGNSYDGSNIFLSQGLMDAFGDMNLPKFIVYYHELGHHLYSKGAFELEENWMKMGKGTPIDYKENYHHLLNWIEDFYIEDCLLRDHSYLTDVINCIKKLPPTYDILRIEYAFNFWYINQAPTPALTYVDQIAFKAYINRLLALRSSNVTRFGKGYISTLSIKQNTETKFVMLLVEFYNWCVSKKILPKNPLPKLQNPNNHIEGPGMGSGGGSDGSNTTPDPNGKDPNKPMESQQAEGQDEPANHQGDGSNAGSYSEHSRKSGKKNPTEYNEVLPINKPTDLFKEELIDEAKLINKQLLDMSQRMQADHSTLDGLFNMKYKESAVIQPKVIVPNFFNPNRIVDQVLFQEKEHTYMNVAIYRDVSGSTSGHTHKLMDDVCLKLLSEIPVDVVYYLYASGDISIIEVPFVSWPNSDNAPAIYTKNPLYNQLGGGTNSSAIADVITQQLSDKWLNIIITDGDLDDLMRRDNINELLKNVFVVAVNGVVPEHLLNVTVKTKADIENIVPKLATINMKI